MIGKLIGIVDSSFDDHIIVNINNVGYLVYCSSKTLSQLIIGSDCRLFIETHVREDRIHLYGFLSIEEKSFFTLLQSVNGIGTRMALSILSSLAPSQIQSAINMSDKATFRAIIGVGPKLAERIIIELRDKIKDLTLHSAPYGDDSKLTSAIASDAIAALVNLGINRIEAYNLVSAIMHLNQEIQIEDLIKLALQTRSNIDLQNHK